MSSIAKRPRGIVVAAPSSGSGKTTVTLGLLAALRKAGVVVQPFKTGPDYIDTGHHARAAGRPSFNLDTWAMPQDLIASIVSRTAASADISIAEGVMGLFDAGPSRGLSGNGATADLAALLGWPVVLVLDVSGQTETAAALALGCATYRPDVRIAGVILNQVASERHEALIRPGFERIDLPIFGSLRRTDKIHLPERHLGLVQADEHADYKNRIAHLADIVAVSMDLDAIVTAASEAAIPQASDTTRTPAVNPPGQRIAIAQDAAFSFTYNHILQGWRDAGAEIISFSPLADEAPPSEADTVWLPGGYPELHAGQLAAASRFMSGLKALAGKSVPIHGECGGYMVLGQGIEDANGERHAMSGLLMAETSFRQRKLHLGYRRATLLDDCALGNKGTTLYGHEFHYATLVADTGKPLLDMEDGSRASQTAGSRNGSVTGSFFHLLSASRV
ncbi:cobyrinic acid a,c-diamide synthase [Hyphomicrobium nitrativorans NL23]|uniref:Hydrogenobyrinate a,c-diamide synthase n=1 Tax=Hyphomicrobium nitrativorans NL23 TaxID=1029756 RepID=V5SE12_9HYPH|nr:cobyrinate a,c-diamide synthase [Hyphomicrobium nitrativorans]AHB48199.1 cobyrinic acid a,c-diamide synthase [Hyphomicrobium nitrativorans NL23]